MLKASDNTLFKEKMVVVLLTCVQFFNILDFVVMMPLGPMLMRYFSITPLQFAALAASYSISAGVSGIFYSAIADKFNRKSFLIFTLSGFSIMTFLCALSPDYETLLLTRVLTGIFGGIVTPIVYAIIADIIPFERRGKALGTVMASFSITSILGIPTGLLIADIFSWRHTFYFIAVGAVCVIFITLYFLPSIPIEKIKHTPKQIISNFYRISIKMEYQLPFLIMVIFVFSGFMLFPFLSPYAVKNIGIQESDLKYVYLVGGAFTIFASHFSGSWSDKFGSLKVCLSGVLLSLPFIYFYTTVENINLALLLVISTGFMAFINFRMVPIMNLITATPTESERGSFMGILLSLRSFAMAAGTSFTGYILIENSNGRLQYFNYIGYFSMFLAVVGAFLVIKLNSYVNSIQQRVINVS